MLEAGIIIFMIGCVLKIWLTLSEHSETRAMSPQPIGERNLAIKTIHRKQRLTSVESTVMITTGAVLILIFGLFN